MTQEYLSNISVTFFVSSLIVAILKSENLSWGVLVLIGWSFLIAYIINNSKVLRW